MSDAPWAKLEAKPRRTFSKPPIALVIAQIQFPAQAEFSNRQMAARFHSEIEGLFPETRQVTGFSVELTLQADLESSGLSSFATPVTTQFYDPSQAWLAALAEDSLTLECRDYPGFEEFQARFSLLIRALSRIAQVGPLRRLGLRYINEARGTDFPARQVASSQIAGVQEHAVLARHLVASHQLLRYEVASTQVSLQHGYFPTGTTVMPVSGGGPTDDFYLLDIDISREFVANDTPFLDTGALVNLSQEFHDIGSALFRWAISDDYESYLGGEE